MTSMCRHDEWLNPTRNLLARWGEHMRSIKGVGLGYSSKASYLAEHGSPSPAPDDQVSDSVDLVLCKVKSINTPAYTVLSMYYYLEYSDRQISDAIKLSRTRCQNIRLSGEVMVATMLHDDGSLINTP